MIEEKNERDCLLVGLGLLHSPNWTLVGPIAKQNAKANKQITEANVNLTILNIAYRILKRNSNNAEHDALSQKY